jgi:hypothetical protein
VDVKIFFLEKEGTERSKTLQIALSDLSHIAMYLLEGETAKAVIPSEPSIPGMYL